MDPQTIKNTTAQSLAADNYDPKRLALLHTGAVLLLSLATAVIHYLLELGMDSAGGLAGIGLRSVLASAQTILSLAGSLILPFWQIGFLSAALKYHRRERVTPGDLLAGFRRFGPVLRLTLLLLLLLMGVLMASSYIASTVFMFSPLSDSLYETMNTLLQDPEITAVTTDMLFDMVPHAGWLLVLNFVIMIAVGLPVYYRFRLSEFALMNGAPGALAALRESALISRHHRMQLFRFDLSIWWYYALLLLISLVGSADLILGLLGISLPISATALYWILFGVSGIANLLFAWQFSAWYQTAYACCYDTLRDWAINPHDAPPQDNPPPFPPQQF